MPRGSSSTKKAAAVKAPKKSVGKKSARKKATASSRKGRTAAKPEPIAEIITPTPERKAPIGRPSNYTSDLAETICLLLIEGESLRRICSRKGMPDKATVLRWLIANGEFRDQYVRARQLQAEGMFDELLDIVDDGSNDWMTIELPGGLEKEFPNHEYIARSKLRADTRKWILSKLLPKKYGVTPGDDAPKENGPLEQLRAALLAAPVEQGGVNP